MRNRRNNRNDKNSTHVRLEIPFERALEGRSGEAYLVQKAGGTRMGWRKVKKDWKTD